MKCSPQCVRLWFLVHHLKFEKLVPSLVYSKFRNTFCVPNSKVSGLLCRSRYHCKNTLLPFKHGLHNKRPKRIIFCCHRQMFKDIYANLLLKLPNLSFFTPEFNMKSSVPPFFLKLFPPFWFAHPKFFSGSRNFWIFKIWFPPFERGRDTQCIQCWSEGSLGMSISFKRIQSISENLY